MKTRLALIETVVERGYKRVAEIGVQRGCATYAIMASTNCPVKEYWAIDPWKPFDENQVRGTKNAWHSYLQGFLKLIKRFLEVKALRKASVEAAPLFPAGYFDLVYIDADHRCGYVYDDIEAWYPKVRSGGVLIGDDYGNKLFPGVEETVDGFFGEDVDIIGAMCSNGGRLWKIEK